MFFTSLSPLLKTLTKIFLLGGLLTSAFLQAGEESPTPFPKAHVVTGDEAWHAYIYIGQDGRESPNPETPYLRGYYQLTYDLTTQQLHFFLNHPYQSWDTLDLENPPGDLEFLDTDKKIGRAKTLLRSLLDGLQRKQEVRISRRKAALEDLYRRICEQLL